MIDPVTKIGDFIVAVLVDILQILVNVLGEMSAVPVETLVRGVVEVCILGRRVMEDDLVQVSYVGNFLEPVDGMKLRWLGKGTDKRWTK